MNEKQRRIFEVDRRMELRMRLVAKQAEIGEAAGGTSPLNPELPEREVVSRLIARVRRL
jgi:hypothetical protein